MSAQFGRWNLDGTPVDAAYLQKAKAVISPYGPDGEGVYTKHNVAIAYRAFHTTSESRCERQPHISASGAVISWDGRLDNRTELIGSFNDLLTADSTDLSIVAAAYDRWGTGCFSRLVGDWALSIWNPRRGSLVLAKDPIGTRHLYYSFGRDQVTWSTILDPLVVLAGRTFQLNEEYIAGWLSSFPAAHLTPYIGIHSVPPSCYVLLRPESCSVKKYWDFDPDKRIVYSTDREYEEHFRAVFSQAVRRRLRSDYPILAELSGGMDSSSIVCVSDVIIASGAAETPRLDTVSYYNDAEPNWNERPYFTKVEQMRGRTGCHIDVGKQAFFKFEPDRNRFAATPCCGGDSCEQFIECMNSQGNRVVLSGIGGDEVTGGVPTPIPELEDLLARAAFKTLAHQLKAWALNKRKPWFHLFSDTARRFLPYALVGIPDHKQPARWLTRAFVKRHRAALQGYESRLKLLGPLPSFQENVLTLELLRRQLECDPLPSGPPFEKRYPYLDRSLLEFLYAIPREQLVRPGQRRSLMRRALLGIVPDEILNRKRKAFVSRSPLTAISAEWSRLAEMRFDMVTASLKIVDPNRFCEVVQKARAGREVALVTVIRTLVLESWLGNLQNHRFIPGVEQRTHKSAYGLTSTVISAEKH